MQRISVAVVLLIIIDGIKKETKLRKKLIKLKIYKEHKKNIQLSEYSIVYNDVMDLFKQFELFYDLYLE